MQITANVASRLISATRKKRSRHGTGRRSAVYSPASLLIWSRSPAVSVEPITKNDSGKLSSIPIEVVDLRMLKARPLRLFLC